MKMSTVNQFVEACAKDIGELLELAEIAQHNGDSDRSEMFRIIADRYQELLVVFKMSNRYHELKLAEEINRERTEEEKAAALQWLEEMKGVSVNWV